MVSPLKPRRPLHRLHISTWLVAALVSLFFCLWNVAGYYREREPAWEASVWAFGWPWTYLEQPVESTGFPFSRRVDDGIVLNPWKTAAKFRGTGFVLDGVVGLAICLSLVAGFEVWRRQRAHLFQIYLAELGLLTLFIAIILGSGRFLVLSSDANQDALREFERSAITRTESVLPEFMHQRLPSYLNHRPQWMDDHRHWDDTVVEARIHDPIDPEQMRTICRQRSLRKLEINSPMPSAVWQMVTGCRRLEEVSISQNSLYDADLKVLAQLPRLRKLDLPLERLTDAGLRHVGKIKTLQELSLREVFPGLIGEGLQHLDSLPLTKLELDFDRSKCSECDLTPLGSLNHLRNLRIHHKPLTSRDVAALRKLSDLETLNLFDCEFENVRQGEMLFRDLANLRSLVIGVDSIPPEIGRAISQMSGLEELRVHGSDSFNEDAAWISQITSLQRLYYYAPGKRDMSSGIALLTKLPHLEDLEFYSDGVMDGAVDWSDTKLP